MLLFTEKQKFQVLKTQIHSTVTDTANEQLIEPSKIS